PRLACSYANRPVKWGQATAQGLSPRTRGNLRTRGPRLARVGSIPAHAGEPSGRASASPTPRVYPRARGGTVGGRGCGRRDRGLSPRTRGNPVGWAIPAVDVGSIPAHAGEPMEG